MSIIFLSLNCSQNNHDFRGLIHSLKLCGYLGEKKHVSVTGHPWIMIYFEHSVSLFVPSLAQCSTHTCFWGNFIFLSLWHDNSGFFEMHHISATLKTQSLYGFSNEGSNIQIWDTWRALHEATPEIREQNLNLKSLSDQHRTAPVFVNRNEFLNI